MIAYCSLFQILPVQDQSSMTQEDTGDWTLVWRMQPQAGLNLSGHQFLIVLKKKKKAGFELDDL